jgi:hypothetical protein
MTYATEAETEAFKASTSTEPSWRRRLRPVLLEIGMVTRGDCASGVAEAKRGTTAMIVASEKRILSGQVELVLTVELDEKHNLFIEDCSWLFFLLLEPIRPDWFLGMIHY